MVPGVSADVSAWCRRTWCWRTSAGRWRPARSTSPSAIPISSTARATPCAIVEALHREWPGLTYDVTIKVEHLLKHRELLPVLKRTGCLFVTSAVESLDEPCWRSWPRATRAPISARRCELMRAAGLPLVADVHPVHAVDDARRATAIAARAGGTGSGGAGGADPAGDPAADSGRLAAAGTAGSARDDRAVRCARRCAIRGSNADPAMDALCAEIQETDQARRAATDGPRARCSARSGTWRSGRVPGDLPLVLARDDSVSERALVLLSGAHRRAVSSCVMALAFGDMVAG